MERSSPELQLERRHNPILSLFSLQVGDKITGNVYSVDQKGAYVDVGGKSAAFVPANELSLSSVSNVSDHCFRHLLYICASCCVCF